MAAPPPAPTVLRAVSLDFDDTLIESEAMKRDAHERGAHGGRISAGGNRRVADISPDLCFSAVKNHGLSANLQIVKSHFRCRPILLLDEDPTLELKTLVWGIIPLLEQEKRETDLSSSHHPSCCSLIT